MSQYGEIYRSEFVNFQGEVIRIDICPTDNVIDDADTPAITQMQPSAEPLVISTVNNDEDKFQPIKGKQAVIKVKTDSLIRMGLFTYGPDNLFFVKITNETLSQIIFLGYLITDDLEEPLLPAPNELTLIASDRLATLKDVPLVNFDGDNPLGNFRLADLIAWTLNKTGLSLPIRVVNNLRVGTGSFPFSAQFSASLKRILLPTAAAQYFYPGMQFTTNSVSNPGPFSVAAVAGGIVSLVQLNETVVDEGPVTLTFTDANTSKHFYDAVYLSAQTFEKEIRSCEDCYTVLSKILGADCTIFQYRGEWWIVRIDEYEGNPFYLATFNADGSFASFDGTIDLDRTIGSGKDWFLIGADATARPTRPIGFAKETFNYNYPKELICNIDLSRGTNPATTGNFIGETVEGVPDCWTFYREDAALTNATLDQPPFAGSAASLRKVFDFGMENERYLSTLNAGGYLHYYKSQLVYVQEKDLITLSVSMRMVVNDPDGNKYPVQVRLEASDGTLWVWQYYEPFNQNEWKQVLPSDAWFTYQWGFDTSTPYDTSEWRSISAPAIPVPRDGKLYILLVNETAGKEVQFNDLSFQIQSFVNGGYLAKTGQYSKVTRTDPGYLANVDDEVFISDAPNRNMKGALLLVNDGVPALLSRFYAGAPFALGNPPGPDYVHPYGHLQAYSVWNQFRNDLRKIAGNVLWKAGDWPDLPYKFTLTDSDYNTVAREFIILAFQQSWKSCIFNCTLCEVYNTSTGKVYSDPFEFKYLT